MKEKLENKISEQINKILERDNFTLNEIKTMIDIKNTLEMREIFEKGISYGFASSKEIEKGE